VCHATEDAATGAHNHAAPASSIEAALLPLTAARVHRPFLLRRQWSCVSWPALEEPMDLVNALSAATTTQARAASITARGR